jgi:hypothetical protein
VVSVVQVATSGSFTNAVSFGTGVTLGNYLIISGAAYNNASPPTSGGSPTVGGVAPVGAAQAIQEGSGGSNSVYAATWLLPVTAAIAGQTAVSMPFTGAAGHAGITAIETTGWGGTPAVDRSSAGGAGSTAVNSGTTSATQYAPEFIMAWSIGYSQAQPSPSGYTIQNAGGNSDFITGYQIAGSSGGTYSWAGTGSPSANWAAGVVTFGVAGGTPHTGTAALTVTPAFSAARVRGKYRTAALTVTPAFSATGSKNGSAKTATAALTVVPVFSAARLQAHVRSAALTVTPQFSAHAKGGKSRGKDSLTVFLRALGAG